MNPKVISKERKKPQLGLSCPRGAKHLDIAKVEIGKTQLFFSRYSTESEWYLDSQFENGWMPVFHHGEGSRCCAKKVAQGQLHDAIEDADLVDLVSNDL